MEMPFVAVGWRSGAMESGLPAMFYCVRWCKGLRRRGRTLDHDGDLNNHTCHQQFITSFTPLPLHRESKRIAYSALIWASWILIGQAWFDFFFNKKILVVNLYPKIVKWKYLRNKREKKRSANRNTSIKPTRGHIGENFCFATAKIILWTFLV